MASSNKSKKSSSIGKTEYAWVQLFADNPCIINAMKSEGICELSAKLLRKYREPRLMTKHDASTGVPKPLQDRHLNVLPISRSSYVLGDFELFEPFPDVSGLKPKHAEMPQFDTLNAGNITSESNAINALIVSGILEDFLEEDNVVETFNGRMGSGDFDFSISRKSGGTAHIEVRGAQLEIDGGFETESSVIIMEAKNVRYDDFHVRQLYYPYRKYRTITSKPIRLVFSQYTNYTYYLFEYNFADYKNYSSIKLLKSAAYTFEDSRITADDLWEVCNNTEVITDDNMENTSIPFIQADRFDRILALMERLSEERNGMKTEDVALFMQTTNRQAAYYPAAGEYLGLFDRSERGKTKLSDVGKAILSLGYRDRQLSLAALMFEHKVFHTLFEFIFKTGSYPDSSTVIGVMEECNVCRPAPQTYRRRSQTVLAWLRWLMSIIDDDE